METKRLVSENQPKCQDDTKQHGVVKFDLMGFLVKWDMDTYLRKIFDGTSQDESLQDSITVFGQVNQPG